MAISVHYFENGAWSSYASARNISESANDGSFTYTNRQGKVVTAKGKKVTQLPGLLSKVMGKLGNARFFVRVGTAGPSVFAFTGAAAATQQKKPDDQKQSPFQPSVKKAGIPMWAIGVAAAGIILFALKKGRK